MESTSQRLVIAFLLLTVFATGVTLRYTGLHWAMHGGGSTPHPDERHVGNCVDSIYLEPVSPREEGESHWDYWKRYWHRQLLESRTSRQGEDPPLKPVNYNYGSFPFYFYKVIQAMTVPDWSSMVNPAVYRVLLIGLLFLIVQFCWSMRGAGSKPGLYLKILPLCILLPLLGWFLLEMIPHSLVNVMDIAPNWGMGTILVGRFVTALFGSLTLLVVYLIGKDAYGRWTGLLAAALLAVAVLHVQLSHFATVDVILAFWIAVAIFSFHRIALSPRLPYYLLGAVAAGFAIGTKWSAVTLPGILLLAHAIGTWGKEEHGQTGRWIHSVWLLLSGLVLLHFFRAASSTSPPFHITLASFRDFYLSHIIGFGILFLILFLISIFLLYCRSWWHGHGRWGVSLAGVYRPWVYLLIAIPVGMGALFIAEPLAFLDAASFARDVTTQHGLIVTGDTPAVYTQQYVGTMPIFYSLDNLFYPSLDWITAFFAIAGACFAVYMAVKYRNASDILLLAWVLPNFLLYSTFLCKFPRYLVTIVPFLLLFGARLLVAMARIRPAMYSPAMASWPLWAIRGAKRIGAIGIVLCLLCGTVYGIAYLQVYLRPHTYYQAADWLRAHDAQGKRILSQSWDEWLPGIPNAGNLELHTLGDAGLDNTLAMLSKADYLVLPSKRAYGTTFRLPDKFQLTNRFFKLLFSEQLGYELAATVTSEPAIGFGQPRIYEQNIRAGEWPSYSLYDMRWELSSDLEDESFAVYDHPKVVILRNVKRLNAAQMRSAIDRPPDWLEKVTWEDILCARAGQFLMEPDVKWPGLTWYLGIQVLGLFGFVFLFGCCSALTDRGYGFSKIGGLILFAWLSWLLASVRVFALSQGQLLCVFLVLAGLAAIIACRRQAEFRVFLRARWLLIVGMEVFFLISWWIFLCVRAHHPDIFWGEKPMEFSFINAIYRTSVFPPIDPWISGETINYYYYGYVVYALLGRFLGIPPAYMFNLGVTIVPALLGLGVFSLIYNLCRSWKAGVLGGYLVMFSGHLVSYGRFIQSYRQWMEGDSAANGFLPGLIHWFTYLPFALKVTANLLLSAVGLVDRYPPEALQFLNFHGNHFFWVSGHDVIKGTVANEFPCWTFYFADFHPHLIVMPMALAALGLLLAFFRRGSLTPSVSVCVPSVSVHTVSGVDWTILLWFALVLGTIICTNTWDFPALAIVLALVVFLRFKASSPFVHRRIETGSWLTPRGLSVLAWDLLLPFVATVFLAWLLFLPFHHHFVARVTSLRWVTEGNTPLSTLLAFFGIVFWPIVTFLLWRLVFPKGLGDFRLKRLAAIVLFSAVVFALALYVNRANPLGYPAPQKHYEGWSMPSDYRAAAFLLPFLALSAVLALFGKREADERFTHILGILGLGILFGCEFVYLKETWSEPMHRYNTIFKFYLQAWIYLCMFGAIAACLLWRDLRLKVCGQTTRILRRCCRSGWAFVMLLLLLASVVFPVAGGFSITLAPDTNDRKGFVPTLDGMAYMKVYKPDEYRAMQFIRYAISGVPVILEAQGYDRQYREFCMFSTNTGCPTVLGWAHHVGERLHADETMPRKQDVDRIYSTNQPDEFAKLLGKYDVDYIIYGRQELEVSPGCRQRWDSWGNLLDLVAMFDSGPQTSHTSIYAVRKNLNALRGVTAAESPTASPLAEPEPGASMFEGGPGFANGQFKEPRGLCLDSKNRVYVTDTRNYRLQVFDPEGKYIGQIGQQGADIGQFEEPMDAATDRNDQVYVLDTWNHRIQVFDANGVHQNVIQGEFYGPRGIAIDRQTDIIYVTDTGHHVVKVFSPKGDLIRKIGNPADQAGNADGEFNEPIGMDVNSDGEVFVVDTRNARVQVFNRIWQHKASWPVQLTTEPNRGVESHIVCASDGTVFLTDPIGGRVLSFDREGNPLGEWREDADGEPLRTPLGIAVRESKAAPTPGKILLVTDLYDHKVRRIRVP